MSFKKPEFWVLISAAAVVIVAAALLLANPPKAKRSETPASASSVTAYSLAPVYAFDKCLHMNPLSSYNPQGDTGQLYLFDPEGIFTIISMKQEKFRRVFL
jgi:anti-sigma-K factor RskA